MAHVRECDRCHHQTQDQRLDGWTYADRRHMGVIPTNTPRCYELCPSCARSLARWLEESPKADRR